MPVDTRLTDNNNILLIAVIGKFDFSLLNEFRQAYSLDNNTPEKVMVDMRQTSTIDSSALGMLLNMKRYLNKADGEIKLINCNQDVRQILQITHFEKKFCIE